MRLSDRSIFYGKKASVIWLAALFFLQGCAAELSHAPESHSREGDSRAVHELSDPQHKPLEEQGRFTRARRNMIDTQIKERGIKDGRLLEAMFKVKRHLFVPDHLRNSAYGDYPLSIGEGQTISQPYIVAIMTELLNLDGDEKVLEIGTGSGYQAAILAELAKEVYTIEILEPLADRSEKVLNDLGYKNIAVRCGDGYIGWKEHAPFDAIIVTCAPGSVPQPLLDQLAEGGRMIIPVGTLWQELKLFEKLNGRIEATSVIPVRFVPMTGEVSKRQ